MTATQDAPPVKPAKLPREEDPRHPVKRLTALFDEGSLELITPDDDSGMLAAVGKVDGLAGRGVLLRRDHHGRRDGRRRLPAWWSTPTTGR